MDILDYVLIIFSDSKKASGIPSTITPGLARAGIHTRFTSRLHYLTSWNLNLGTVSISIVVIELPCPHFFSWTVLCIMYDSLVHSLRNSQKNRIPRFKQTFCDMSLYYILLYKQGCLKMVKHLMLKYSIKTNQT